MAQPIFPARQKLRGEIRRSEDVASGCAVVEAVPQAEAFPTERTTERANVLACASYMGRSTAVTALTKTRLTHWDKRTWLPVVDTFRTFAA